MSVELADKVAFLATPGQLDTVVETIETHLSCVFLTAHHAYKLKKPVVFSYLDHRSLEQRQRSCEKELTLGQRLAPDVYLGVVPLVETPQGLHLGRPGEPAHGTIVDWLVAMRRLPETAMLPQALALATATIADAEALGDVLVGFYQRAAKSPWTAAEYVARMHALVTSYAGELAGFDVSRRRIAQIASNLHHQIDESREQLGERIALGRVVDAHGDLRPEHVCLETPPVVIDPLEFDDDLRMLDAASELMFFSLECERLARRWFADRVVARYIRRAGDRVPLPLLQIYVGQHALARALIALRRLADTPAIDQPRWLERAEQYFTWATDFVP